MPQAPYTKPTKNQIEHAESDLCSILGALSFVRELLGVTTITIRSDERDGTHINSIRVGNHIATSTNLADALTHIERASAAFAEKSESQTT